MKKLLSFAIVLIAISSFQSCKMITTESTPVTKVVQIENATKNDLYIKANNWMVSAFNNAKSVIQFTDKESGTITGKYLLGSVVASDRFGPGRDVFAIINIQVKDGASKITITPESFVYAKGNPYTLYTEANAENDIEKLILAFERAIQTEISDDW